GTTTDGREVLNFHASLFQPALLTRAAIQPAAIRYMNEAGATAPFIGDDEFVSHVFRMLALEEIEVRLDFLPVLDSTDLTRNTVSCTARNQIAAALAAEDNENVQPIQAAN
ncbi:MAG: lysophospholipid acyltransferase family protein, partial [Gammaproteobacteria bacterium]